jgi:hypothetical protein
LKNWSAGWAEATRGAHANIAAASAPAVRSRY